MKACCRPLWYFNPRSREGSDLWVWRAKRYAFISIHAPAKGATAKNSVSKRTIEAISIHAPAKGATRGSHTRRMEGANFNPRSREGSDRLTCGVLVPRPRISIHAPAKGATAACDIVERCGAYFNPRSREGSDILALLAVLRTAISIHAPAKGATTHHVHGFHGFDISIHAPAKGATYAKYSGRYLIDHFNPRSREGSDTIRELSTLVYAKISIHAPAKGATAKITKTIPDDFHKINNYNNSFAQIRAKHNCKFDIR